MAQPIAFMGSNAHLHSASQGVNMHLPGLAASLSSWWNSAGARAESAARKHMTVPLRCTMWGLQTIPSSGSWSCLPILHNIDQYSLQVKNMYRLIIDPDWTSPPKLERHLGQIFRHVHCRRQMWSSWCHWTAIGWSFLIKAPFEDLKHPLQTKILLVHYSLHWGSTWVSSLLRTFQEQRIG